VRHACGMRAAHDKDRIENSMIRWYFQGQRGACFLCVILPFAYSMSVPVGCSVRPLQWNKDGVEAHGEGPLHITSGAAGCQCFY